jgi:hypothetical protein
MKSYRGLVVALSLLCSTVEARPPRRTNYSSPAPVAAPCVLIERGDDQARCQEEANIMASRRFSGHVGSCIGRFEGVGVGHSPNCNTCTPGSGMRLTGDASAQGSDGRWYRVRSWR